MYYMTTNDIFATARQHIAGQSTQALIEMLAIANDKAIEVLIIETLEVRIDGLSATLDAWAEDFESELTQAQVVLGAVA